MMNYDGVSLNGKHTNYDYGLYVTNTNPVAPPVAKTQHIEVPGRNGNIDITEALTGYTIYGNREITLQLGGKKIENAWPSFMSNFINEIHGKQVKVIFDDNPDYYYIGRATVESDYTRGNRIATFTVTIDAEPYKYEVLSTIDAWKWDSFSFVNGIIRQYNNIAVSGSREYTVTGSEMPIIPVFVASSNMTVAFEGKTYQLKAGENKLYDIVIQNKQYQLTFTGNGTVSIIYRAGRL
jgi:predicted phage tail component-like protein